MATTHEEKYHSPRRPWVSPGEINHLVADLTIQVAADVTLEAVQQKLGEHEQWLPIDGHPASTIESLININSSGPLRLGFGAWRDLLLGMQFLTGDDRLITVGGLPLKNVAGYDLGKLLVGQSNVFGKIKCITARTYRRPAGAIVAELLPDPQLIGRVFATPLKPQWAMLNSDKLLLGYLGDEPTLQFYTQSVKELEPTNVTRLDLPAEIKYRQERWRTAGPWENFPWVFRASVPPTRVSDFVKAAQLQDWVADPAFGIVLGGADEKLTPAFRKAAVSMDGSLQCRSIADGQLMAITANPGERAIIEKLKKVFDKDGKFSPLVR